MTEFWWTRYFVLLNGKGEILELRLEGMFLIHLSARKCKLKTLEEIEAARSCFFCPQKIEKNKLTEM